MHRPYFFLSIVFTALCGSGLAIAKDADKQQLETIQVTARLWREALHITPITIGLIQESELQ